jgi:hypothetical protein
VTAKARVIAAKTGERASTTKPPNPTERRAHRQTHPHVRFLTDMVKVVFPSVEEQKLEQATQTAVTEEQKREQEHEIGTLVDEIEGLKLQVMG